MKAILIKIGLTNTIPIMDKLAVISGEVSNVGMKCRIFGFSNYKTVIVDDNHKTAFRVNGKPAIFVGTISVSDGDQVSFVGVKNGGEFQALALRNDSTQVLYALPSDAFYWNGGFVMVLGVIAISTAILGLLFFGIALIFYGALVVLEGHNNRIARDMLRRSMLRKHRLRRNNVFRNF